QPLNPALGPALAQPPADIAIVPLATFARTLAPALPTIAAGGGTAAVPGAVRGTQWQVQAQVDPRALGGSPAHALRRADQVRNAVERSLPGQVVFVDNLSDSLNSAAGDALYAETLYIMLGVPGAIVALGLAYLAALGTAERDRRDLALLRARGASTRQLLATAGAESAVVGVAAGAVGAVAAYGAVSLLVTGGAHLDAARAVATVAACLLLATLGAGAARVAATTRVLRARVAEGQRAGKPLWQGLYLIFAATYDRQASVDAQLTLGADVAVDSAPGVAASHHLERRVAGVRGVEGTTALDHSYAYVGPDLQDTYGIDAATIGRATTLRDS